VGEDLQAGDEVDLSALLRPQERAALLGGGLEFRNFLALDVPLGWPQRLVPKWVGTKILIDAVVVFPVGVFRHLEPKRVVAGDGKARVPGMENFVPIVPMVRLVLQKKALSDEAVAAQDRVVEAVLAEESTEQALALPVETELLPTSLLQPDERANLQALGFSDYRDFLALDLPLTWPQGLMPQQMTPQAVTFLARIAVPSGVLRQVESRVQIGKFTGELQQYIPFVPALRLIVSKGALTDKALVQLTESVRQQFAAVGARGAFSD